MLALVPASLLEEDLEIGEGDRSMGYDEVAGWFAESASGEPLPEYAMMDPCRPPTYREVIYKDLPMPGILVVIVDADEE